MIRVAVSGGFDPLQVGHLEYFILAKRLGDWLIVIINTDEFLVNKKGKTNWPLMDRVQIIKALRVVDEVIVSIDKDETVAKTLRIVKPDIFANGGDRISGHPLEEDACREIGCKCVYGLGKKIRSSKGVIK